MKFIDNNIYFGSDYHFCHKNIIEHNNRPFKNLDEMNETLISNWNNKVSNDQIVHFIGDFSNASVDITKEILNKLNGKIHLIIGNHDSKILSLDRFESVNSLNTIYVRDQLNSKNYYQPIILCHYPLLSWEKELFGTWHLHGHTHQILNNDPFYNFYYKRKVVDVSCNGHNYELLSYIEIKNIINDREIINYIK